MSRKSGRGKKLTPAQAAARRARMSWARKVDREAESNAANLEDAGLIITPARDPKLVQRAKLIKELAAKLKQAESEKKMCGTVVDKLEAENKKAAAEIVKLAQAVRDAKAGQVSPEAKKAIAEAGKDAAKVEKDLSAAEVAKKEAHDKIEKIQAAKKAVQKALKSPNFKGLGALVSRIRKTINSVGKKSKAARRVLKTVRKAKKSVRRVRNGSCKSLLNRKRKAGRPSASVSEKLKNCRRLIGVKKTWSGQYKKASR